MARMPPAPVADNSCSENPESWSISSWLRMRSAPARSGESSLTPSSIMVAHSAAMSLALTAAPCSASAAAQSSSKPSLFSSTGAPPLLDDDVLEEHRVHLGRVDRVIDAPQQ